MRRSASFENRIAPVDRSVRKATGAGVGKSGAAAAPGQAITIARAEAASSFFMTIGP